MIINKVQLIFKGFLLILVLSSFLLSNLSAKQNYLSMKLKPCPDSPNCVSSQSQSTSHLITPIPYTSSAEIVKAKIKKILLAFPRTVLIKESNDYLHVEFKTLFLRFVDDVEIVINDTEKVIHLRSASRVGRSDLGTNRRRVEAIRKKFKEKD